MKVFGLNTYFVNKNNFNTKNCSSADNVKLTDYDKNLNMSGFFIIKTSNKIIRTYLLKIMLGQITNVKTTHIITVVSLTLNKI